MYLHYTLLLLILSFISLIFSFSSLFTLHFATINTRLLKAFFTTSIAFTLHFATINTQALL